jgi:hypothetical protein
MTPMLEIRRCAGRSTVSVRPHERISFGERRNAKTKLETRLLRMSGSHRRTISGIIPQQQVAFWNSL